MSTAMYPSPPQQQQQGTEEERLLYRNCLAVVKQLQKKLGIRKCPVCGRDYCGHGSGPK